MIRYLLVAAIVVCSSVDAHAQKINDSPYAESRETGWPPFYKPLKVHPRDQFYYAMGWCRTNHYHYKATDLVDIDRLPDVDLTGELAESQELGFALRVYGSKEPMAVHVHPAATHARVRGQLAIASLKLGAILKFDGAVNRRGQALEPVEQLELLSASAESEAAPVAADVAGPIVGRLLRMAGDRLFLGVKTGPIRSISLQVAEGCKATADADDWRLATSGSRVRVKGRVYRADDRIPADQVFATDIEFQLAP